MTKRSSTQVCPTKKKLLTFFHSFDDLFAREMNSGGHRNHLLRNFKNCCKASFYCLPKLRDIRQANHFCSDDAERELWLVNEKRVVWENAKEWMAAHFMLHERKKHPGKGISQNIIQFVSSNTL